VNMVHETPTHPLDHSKRPSREVITHLLKLKAAKPRRGVPPLQILTAFSEISSA